MRNCPNYFFAAIVWVILPGSFMLAEPFSARAQTPTSAKERQPARSASNNPRRFSPQPGGSAVKGSGTAGMIPKWLDATSIGDSIVSEADGNIGIGTTSPGSKLSVAGMIETTMGGYKFPDGTVQSTAGLVSISHNFTLSGDGTTVSPLKIAVPLILSGSVVSSSTLTVHNTGQPNGGAIFAFGGIGANGTNTTTSLAGTALSGLGGSSDSGDAGGGAAVHGGKSNSGHGGWGVVATGDNIGRLYRIDPKQPAGDVSVVTNSLGSFPRGVTTDGDSIWVAGTDVVLKVDPSNGDVTTFTGFDSAFGLLYDGSNVWVTEYQTVKKLAPNGNVLQTLPAGKLLGNPTFDGINIWVSLWLQHGDRNSSQRLARESVGPALRGGYVDWKRA